MTFLVAKELKKKKMFSSAINFELSDGLHRLPRGVVSMWSAKFNTLCSQQAKLTIPLPGFNKEEFKKIYNFIELNEYTNLPMSKIEQIRQFAQIYQLDDLLNELTKKEEIEKEKEKEINQSNIVVNLDDSFASKDVRLPLNDEEWSFENEHKLGVKIEIKNFGDNQENNNIFMKREGIRFKCYDGEVIIKFLDLLKWSPNFEELIEEEQLKRETSEPRAYNEEEEMGTPRGVVRFGTLTRGELGVIRRFVEGEEGNLDKLKFQCEMFLDILQFAIKYEIEKLINHIVMHFKLQNYSQQELFPIIDALNTKYALNMKQLLLTDSQLFEQLNPQLPTPSNSFTHDLLRDHLITNKKLEFVVFHLKTGNQFIEKPRIQHWSKKLEFWVLQNEYCHIYLDNLQYSNFQSIINFLENDEKLTVEENVYVDIFNFSLEFCIHELQVEMLSLLVSSNSLQSILKYLREKSKGDHTYKVKLVFIKEFRNALKHTKEYKKAKKIPSFQDLETKKQKRIFLRSRMNTFEELVEPDNEIVNSKIQILDWEKCIKIEIKDSECLESCLLYKLNKNEWEWRGEEMYCEKYRDLEIRGCKMWYKEKGVFLHEHIQWKAQDLNMIQHCIDYLSTLTLGLHLPQYFLEPYQAGFKDNLMGVEILLALPIGGSLTHIINKDPQIMFNLLGQLIDGIGKLKLFCTQGLTLGGFNPKNIYYDGNHVKLGGLGYSKYIAQLFKPQLCAGEVNTQGYLYDSPEFLHLAKYNNPIHHNLLTQAMDIYSLGVVFYEFICTNEKINIDYRYNSEQYKIFYDSIANNIAKNIDLEAFNEDQTNKFNILKVLIQKMLEFDPSKRPTFQQINTIMNLYSDFSSEESIQVYLSVNLTHSGKFNKFEESEKLLNEALQLERNGNLIEALARLEEFMKVGVDIYPKASEKIGRCLYYIGLFNFQLQKLTISEENFQKSVSIFGSLGQIYAQASGLRYLGRIFSQRENWEPALHAYEESSNIVIEHGLGVHPLIGENSMEIGGHLIEKEPILGVEELKRGIESLEITEGPLSRSVALCQYKLGAYYIAECEYVQGKEHLLIAGRIIKIVSEERNMEDIEEKCFHRLGVACQMVGDYKRALKYIKRSHKITKRKEAKASAPLFTSNIQIASLYIDIAQNAQAKEIIKKSIRALNKATQHISADSLRSLIIPFYLLLAEIYIRDGENTLFKSTMSKAYQCLSHSSPNPPNTKEYAMYLFTTAKSEHKTGDLDKALNIYNQSLQIFKLAPLQNHIPILHNILYIGLLMLAQQNITKGRNLLNQSFIGLIHLVGPHNLQCKMIKILLDRIDSEVQIIYIYIYIIRKDIMRN